MTPARSAPLIKVCGLTREEDLRLCCNLGARMLGFIFAKGSPRRVNPEEAARLGAAAPPHILRVGVFAGQTADEVTAIMETAGLHMAQLHGGEDRDFCRAVGPHRVIKALWPERLYTTAKNSGAASWQNTLAIVLREECEAFADVCAMFLLDAGAGGGGSGRALAWDALAAFTPSRPWLLAGGLGPGNAVQALERCTPTGLDCNSGLESAPGVKDAAKLRALFASLPKLAAVPHPQPK